jgi:hypothetical protein
VQLKASDVLDVISIARKFFIELPAAAQLPQMTRRLDEAERRALAFFQGSLNLMNRRGLLRSDLKPGDLDLEYEIADSQVVSAEYETEASTPAKSL